MPWILSKLICPSQDKATQSRDQTHKPDDNRMLHNNGNENIAFMETLQNESRGFGAKENLDLEKQKWEKLGKMLNKLVAVLYCFSLVTAILIIIHIPGL